MPPKIKKTPPVSQSDISLPALFETAKIDPHRDTYKISGGAGVAVAHIKNPSGEVRSVYIRADGAYKQMVRYDPSDLSVEQRRELELALYKEKRTQSEIADLLGVSQATVCLDLKRLRDK